MDHTSRIMTDVNPCLTPHNRTPWDKGHWVKQMTSVHSSLWNASIPGVFCLLMYSKL